MKKHFKKNTTETLQTPTYAIVLNRIFNQRLPEIDI